MEPAPAEPTDWARRDLVEAVEVALGRTAHLLTAGEQIVADRFLALPEPSGSLFARLLGRRPAVFRLDGLAYAEVPDIEGAAACLVEHGLAWRADRCLPTSALATALRVPELKAACRVLGRPAGGRRDELLERLADLDARQQVARPSIVLRHRGLFRRLARLYLHDHTGDLARLVVARLGLVKYPAYQPTGGGGLFPCRRDLVGYEQAMSHRWSLEGTALAEDAARAVAAVEALPAPPDWRARYSARRFEEDVALGGAREIERQGRPGDAAAIYRRLLRAGPRPPTVEAATLRLAHCLGALGQPADGAAVCAAALHSARPAATLALQRTGRRLARAAGTPWVPLPPLRRAPGRELDLVSAELAGARPGWEAPSGAATTVENAVVELLASLGRRALHTESGIWSTLFGLLYRDALFAPVPGMLPSPLLTGPIDLGSPGFAERRAPQLAAIRHRILAGKASDDLRSALADHHGEAIAGVRWELAEDLICVADAVGPVALDAILCAFLDDLKGARRGMPDLCVLPGDEVRLATALPGRLSPELLLVEVKGPGDSLSDEQRVWLDRLLGAGLRSEVWRVRVADPRPSSDQ